MQSGWGGAFNWLFPVEFTQAECQTMLNYLSPHNIGLLIEAGVPDGTSGSS